MSNELVKKLLFRILGKGAVVANGIQCAAIGGSILAQEGSAADAAIATLFCEGVSCPQCMGLGGGFTAVIYERSTGNVETLIARETAPLQSTENMFVNKKVEDGIAVAVPGELRGFWSLHQKYGRLPWSKLVQPTIDLCRNGIKVSTFLHSTLKQYELKIRDPVNNMAEVFINPETGLIWAEGELMKRPQLADTLEKIAKDGDQAMYDGGSIGKLLVEDIRERGGIITEDDFKEYKVRWGKPVTSTIFNDYILHTTPLPTSGIVLNFILNLMTGLITEDRPLFYHRLIECFKHAYGLRTQLGDVEFLLDSHKQIVANFQNQEFIDSIRGKISDDHTCDCYQFYGATVADFTDSGTGNIAILAPNGDAIAITSTINTEFGAKFRSKSTGIILNDEMDDFSTPGKRNFYGFLPSAANFIKPKKMPMSSMCPSIILNKKGEVCLIIGAAGGSKIISSVAHSIIKYLAFREPFHNAVQGKRVHHQLVPMECLYERDFDPDIISYLTKKLKHAVRVSRNENGFTALTGIGTLDGVAAAYDTRRGGSTMIIEYIEESNMPTV